MVFKLRKWLMLCAIAVSCHAGAIENSNVLRFGTEAIYPPFEYKSAAGLLQGIDIELGQAICTSAGLRCNWSETTFDGLIPGLLSRRFDVINASMDVTEKRHQQIDFTEVIYQIPSRLLVKKGSGLLPDPRLLNGKRLGVLQASSQEMFARVHWAPRGVDVIAYQNQEQVYQDLAADRLDATLVMEPAGQYGFLSRPEGDNFTFVGNDVSDGRILGLGIAFGLRRGDISLKQKLNKAIDEIKARGLPEAISKKYFGGA